MVPGTLIYTSSLSLGFPALDFIEFRRSGHYIPYQAPLRRKPHPPISKHPVSQHWGQLHELLEYNEYPH